MKDINLKYMKDKVYIPFEEHYEILKEERKEIERLNNIINDLEKQLLEWNSYWEDEDTYNDEYKTAYDYLQELKGSDKE